MPTQTLKQKQAQNRRATEPEPKAQQQKFNALFLEERKDPSFQLRFSFVAHHLCDAKDDGSKSLNEVGPVIEVALR